MSRELDLGVHSRLSVEWQVRQASAESAALTVAAMQSGGSVQLTSALSPQLQAEALVSSKSHRTQSGSALGGRTLGALGLTYAVRQAYPDVVVKASLQRVLSRPSGTVDALAGSVLASGVVAAPGAFVGPSSTAVSASVGYGSSVRADAAPGPTTPYSRTFRPFAEFGIDLRRDNTGRQLSPLLRLGGRGAVLGRDQLVLGWEMRPQSNGSATKEIKLQYEYVGN